MLSHGIQTREDAHVYVDPSIPLNVGLWTLYAGATAFLGLRVWIKITRRHGLWYDDWILIVSWIILTVNNSLISLEFATGYVADVWDDRMHILINITSCGTLVGQALTKTAFAVTLLKLTKGWQRWVLWYIIVSMNLYMVVKVVFQWAKIYDKPSYNVWYRINLYLDWDFRQGFKEGGNVYNIIMDFVLALFPWIITWHLDMRRVEKVGLCATMSLGMIVAVVSAIRTGWKSEGNDKDTMYFWRNALSNVWFSSEVVGTIIVQCIPVLRPLIRDIHTSLTSKKLASNIMETAPGTGRRSKQPAEYITSHSATAYSDGKGDTSTDSWDNQGIYHKTDFELSSMEIKNGKQETSLV
ncbi:hypothetical protein P153DRAFT_388091 [Dothidotthia symphoricarpi CBS 119687]|uniref:Rhodopsin domain-containing protein n=1 Tax=Dothidotthia symphoricarpi CBS 119687 TaxID=1392245 RepID=A0A6A6A4E4_9PLEO|nr:uncharacterized protein P153DRAFT_388091 [Dothidotthia symphoricarpi CBS 119687]KAF2126769.1 hypothetical protein P153DRAFT_388091 [Dothidotthia symphoricarpi CBS 119687]